MLTHAAVMATIASSNAFMRLQLGVDVTEPCDLVFLSYLSLCHIFDRVMEELIISLGGCIGYWQGDILSLMDDIAALRPTVLCVGGACGAVLTAVLIAGRFGCGAATLLLCVTDMDMVDAYTSD